MNNRRLLTGRLAAILMSIGVCAFAQQAPPAPTVYTLEQLFEIAETNSTQLRPARAAEAEALTEIEVAKMNRLPDIQANLSVSFIGDGFTTKRDFSDYQKAPIPHFGNNFGINVTQPVYAGGAITKGIELAELKLTASRYATDFNRDNIRFGITGFYLDIYKYHNLRTVVEQNIAQARQVLTQMNNRHEQGMALHNDITRYELLVQNLELQLIKIDNTIKILNDNLATMTGLPAGITVAPDSAILAHSLPTQSADGWRQAALTNSPSLRMAQSSVDISRKAEELVYAERLPKVGLQAAYSLEGPILVEVPPINRNLSYWYVGVGVSYNLSSLFKNDKSMARAKAASATAFDRLEVLRENTELEVRNDYVRYMEAYEELKTQEKSVELANSNYAVVETRYSAGMALITDMLDAANSLLDAQQLLVNARINIIYYYYKLLFTSGQI
ncbi:MAG: TolC family protein [Muribaculaceae bacterium]|nr:TolC family protein [Muribaculaceae bacterium]